MSRPGGTMATTSQPSPDFSVSLAASDAASKEDTLTESNSYMGGNRNAARRSVTATGVVSRHDEGVDVGVAGRAVEDRPRRRGARRRARRRSTVVSSWVATTSVGAVAVGPVEQLEQRLAAGLVEADERLVDEQQLERADEGEGDRRLLAQPAAERRRQVVARGRRARACSSRSAACCSQSSVPCSRAMYSRCSHTVRSS